MVCLQVMLKMILIIYLRIPNWIRIKNLNNVNTCHPEHCFLVRRISFFLKRSFVADPSQKTLRTLLRMTTLGRELRFVAHPSQKTLRTLLRMTTLGRELRFVADPSQKTLRTLLRMTTLGRELRFVADPSQK